MGLVTRLSRGGVKGHPALFFSLFFVNPGQVFVLVVRRFIPALLLTVSGFG